MGRKRKTFHGPIRAHTSDSVLAIHMLHGMLLNRTIWYRNIHYGIYFTTKVQLQKYPQRPLLSLPPSVCSVLSAPFTHMLNTRQVFYRCGRRYSRHESQAPRIVILRGYVYYLSSPYFRMEEKNLCCFPYG